MWALFGNPKIHRGTHSKNRPHGNLSQRLHPIGTIVLLPPPQLQLTESRTPLEDYPTISSEHSGYPLGPVRRQRHLRPRRSAGYPTVPERTSHDPSQQRRMEPTSLGSHQGVCVHWRSGRDPQNTVVGNPNQTPPEFCGAKDQRGGNGHRRRVGHIGIQPVRRDKPLT